MAESRTVKLEGLDKSTISLALMVFADMVDGYAETQRKIANEIDTDPNRAALRRQSADGDINYAIDIRALRSQVDDAETVSLTIPVYQYQ